MRLRFTSALLLPLLLGQGCIVMTIPSFIHDKMLGPASPAGRTRAYASQEGFNVTDEGVVAYESGHLYRPYPLDWMTRGRPESFYFIVKGVEALISGISPVVVRDTRDGEPLPPERLAKLRPGATSAEVLDALGTPQLWIKRKTGSLMAYKAKLKRAFTFYIGTPPFLSRLVPIPGVNNLNFRYTSTLTKPYKTLLQFDSDEILIGVSSNELPEQGSVAEE